MMEQRTKDEVPITSLFDQFIEANTMQDVLTVHQRIIDYADLKPCEFGTFFPKLKRSVMANRTRKNWKAKALFSKIDKKAMHKCYSNNKAPTPLGVRLNQNNSDTNNSILNTSGLDFQDSLASDNNFNASQHSARYVHTGNNVLSNYNCLIIGAGPAGLRTAIELQLLGASRVVIVEKRGRFSRNNVLHLWPFVIDDLKSLGAKKFYGKFCAGSIDHISIRQLQLILLKISLMIGCEFRHSSSYAHICPESLIQTNQKKKCMQFNVGDNNEHKDDSSRDNPICSYKQQLDGDGAKAQVDSAVATHEKSALERLASARIKATSDNQLNRVDAAPNSGARENQLDDKSADDTSLPLMKSRAHSAQLLSQRDVGSGNAAIAQHNTTASLLRGVKAHFDCDSEHTAKQLHSIEWDVIVGADGRRNTLGKFFPRKEFRGRLAIAITANFINRQTPKEAAVPEISGLSFIYNQDMFNALAYDTNIQLENICYYKDETHYFVMTAKKKSLLERGVLIDDYAATQDLLSDSNVNRQALLQYARDAASWTTELEPLDFALNHYGQEDCAMFDFTSMYAAQNACKALRTRSGGMALLSLVGDSLLEPFWPTGSGCARGFLSSFDAAWMVRQWAFNKCAVVECTGEAGSTPRASRNQHNRSVELDGRSSSVGPYNRMALSVMAERESIYRILAQTTSENLQQNYARWTLNPHTRYPNLNRHLVGPSQCEHLVTDSVLGKASIVTPKPHSEKTTRRQGRTLKSPVNAGTRRSPKKLKSAGANRSPAMGRNKHGKMNGKSARELDEFEQYLALEASYNDLDETGRAVRADCELYDDLLVPSISGTMPSSSNLMSLEARRARDIDECLRQRRQRSQLSFVRDKLIDKFKTNSSDDAGDSKRIALLQELRRLREMQRDKENDSGRSRWRRHNTGADSPGPLTLLNSMRRCVSFAERVKDFETRLSQQQATAPSTPKVGIDNVKNLPQFNTLQELFVAQSSATHGAEPVSQSKRRVPVMKLSKDDWNVKCWEDKINGKQLLAGRKLLGGSSISLHKSLSVDEPESICAYRRAHLVSEPRAPAPQQIEMFKNRIKDMADKLDRSHSKPASANSNNHSHSALATTSSARSAGTWVSQIRNELIKGSKAQSTRPFSAQISQPTRTIKKLFADDDEDSQKTGSSHCDHLCINKPKNKYLARNNYKSHLARPKIGDVNGRIINRSPQISAESKQAYMSAVASKNVRNNDSNGFAGLVRPSLGAKPASCVPDEACARCNKRFEEAGTHITIGDVVLHRTCLMCAVCGITLRTNEIQHYIEVQRAEGSSRDFVCAICCPQIRVSLQNENSARVLAQTGEREPAHVSSAARPTAARTRADFLNEKIDYNELYKNILDNSNRQSVADKLDSLRSSSSRDTTPTAQESSKHSAANPSPVSVTLPLKLVTSNGPDTSVSEQVTLELPRQISALSSASYNADTSKRALIDEHELNRINLHDRSNVDDGDENVEADDACSTEMSDSDSLSESSVNEAEESAHSQDNSADESSDDESSSLNSPPDTESVSSRERVTREANEQSHGDDYEDDDDDDDDDDEDDFENVNSTYEDFLTSEEFGDASDRDEVISGRRSSSGVGDDTSASSHTHNESSRNVVEQEVHT